MNFGDFLGNTGLKESLSLAMAQGKLSHSYLLSGPRGSGKHTLARQLAAGMECTGQGEQPCGRCPACRKVFGGIHPDVIVCTDDRHKQFGVDAARQVILGASLRPNEGRKKIFLFPQEMNLAAQNALLKLIEEPPAYVVFLFLTENVHTMLPTVRSRCQELTLSPLSRELLRGHLPPEADERIIEESGGYLGQALELMAGEADSPRAQQLASALRNRDKLAFLELFTGMERLSRDAFRQELQGFYRLIYRGLRSGTRRYSGAQLVAALEVLKQADAYAQGNVGVGHLCGSLYCRLTTILLTV